MFEKRKPVYEKVDPTPHPEHQEVNTSVAEYFRKYGQGKIDTMPTDPRPEITDDRSVEEMLSDDGFEPSLGTDELDVIEQLQKMEERFKDAQADAEATKKQKNAFENAVKIINDKNSSYDDRIKAYEVLEELEKKGKIKRARALD